MMMNKDEENRIKTGMKNNGLLDELNKQAKDEGSILEDANTHRVSKEDKRLANLRPNVFTSENQPSPEVKAIAAKKRWERKHLADMLFDKLTKLGAIDKGMDVILEKIEEKGSTKELIDVLRIITPKDIDVTTKGKALTESADKEAVEDRIKQLTKE